MHRLLFAAALIFLQVAPPCVLAEDGCSAWWVFFTDRGPDVESRLAARTAELTASPSLARRTAAGLTGADLLDLEPWAGYIAQVSSISGAASIRTTSRFLNAVSINADSSQLDRILVLPSVAAVRPVAGSDFLQPVLTPLPLGITDLTSFQLGQIGLDQLHLRGWTGADLRIGVLDTGYELDHGVFASTTVLGAYDFIHGDDDPSWQEGDPPGQSDHGTAVLSILGGFSPAAGFAGGAPSAAFLVAKTEDISDEYEAEEDYWVEGLEWVEAGGADLVSSSLGYIDWYTYEDMDGNTAVTTIAADAAASRGMPVFSSIGNRGPASGTLGAPSDGDSVVAIGAVDATGAVAGFSSRGPTFDGRTKPCLCALGVGVVLADAEGGYSSGNGTSFAAPLCAAAAAAIAGAHPEWTLQDVIVALQSTASQGGDPDNDLGWGVIDALAALRYHSITGVVRASLDGTPLAGYPVGIVIGDTTLVSETNGSGCFAVCPGLLGEFRLFDAGGPGSMIPSAGVLTGAGVEVEVFVDGEGLGSGASVFPNPSSGGVYIGFDVPEGPVDVDLSVHSLTGELVQRQSRSGLPAGCYRAPLPGEALFWDGLDAGGQPAASGTYLLILRIGGETLLLKAAIVR
jgi:hypothetical protein